MGQRGRWDREGNRTEKAMGQIQRLNREGNGTEKEMGHGRR